MRVFVGALLAAALPGVGLAQAQSASGTATFQVFALAQGSQQLCPGEQLQIWAGVNQLTTRTGAAGSKPVTRSMPYARVYATLPNNSIGIVGPSFIRTGATQSSRGGFTGLFTFTAQGLGQTTIDFSGDLLPNYINVTNPGARVSASPASVTVTVACNYTISLCSVWRLPGDRTLDVLGAVSSAKLTPNTSGRFSTRATMSSTAAWMGPCPGASRIRQSNVTIWGDLTGGVGYTGRLLTKVLYDPVSSTTTEGCVGRSRSDRGQPDMLDVDVDSDGGVLTPSHVLHTYVDAIGSTTVVVKRIP